MDNKKLLDNSSHMHSDRPIQHCREDRLGFCEIAHNLAEMIMHQSSREGFVIGIEGEWGSGKSSLLNLIKEKLSDLDENSPVLVNFSPWLIGERINLLSEIFHELLEAVLEAQEIEERIERKSNSFCTGLNIELRQIGRILTRGENNQQHTAQLEAFGRLAGGLSSVAELGNMLGIPYFGIGSKALKAAEETTRKFNKPTIFDQKKELETNIKRFLKRRIVVFIDDLDRLEPDESVEVLRLVRSVADLPNIIYILSYDLDNLGHMLEQTLKVKNGQEYLEKMLQVSFRIPRPDQNTLRDIFRNKVEELWKGTENNIQYPSSNMNFETAIRVYATRYLRTPRDLNRTLNALYLYAVPVMNKINMGDMVWIQLIRLGNPDLYSWVEEYVSRLISDQDLTALGNNIIRNAGIKLCNILEKDGVEAQLEFINLRYFLPGIANPKDPKGEKNEWVYQTLNQEWEHSYIGERRIASPQHYKNYFALNSFSGDITEYADQFIEQAEQGSEEATELFAKFFSSSPKRKSAKADEFLDQLIARQQMRRIPLSAIQGIIAALAITAADAPLPSQDIAVADWNWSKRNRLLRALLGQLDNNQRHIALKSIFEKGREIGWAISLLRSETFAHDLYGDRPKPKEDWLLNKDELQQALQIMFSRFETMTTEEFVHGPDPLEMLYCWLQGGGNKDNIRNWIIKRMENDADFLHILSRMQGTITSSEEGIYQILKRSDLQHFLDYDSARQRTKHIADRLESPVEQREIAQELLESFARGEKARF